MIIRCLGMVGVAHDGGVTTLGRSQRRIVAILTAAGPDGLSSAAFADELYGEDLPEKWEASVRQQIRRMRKALPVGTLVNRRGRYLLDLEPDDIDVWKLLALDRHDLAPDADSSIAELLRGDAFPDVEPTWLLRERTDEINEARVALVERLADRRVATTTSVLSATRALAERLHFRDDVLAASLELHLTSGMRTPAAALLDRARDYLRHEMQLELGPRSAAVAEAMRRADEIAVTGRGASDNSTADTPRRSIGEGDDAVVRTVGLFDTPTDLDMIRRAKVAVDLEHRLDGPGAIVVGDSGAGKTALVRALVAPSRESNVARSARRHVLWLTGRSGTPAAYAAFIAGLPVLQHDLGPLLDDGGTDLVRAQCWAAVRRRLHTEFPGLALTVVIDDAQWLDSHSQGLVRFLAAAAASSEFSLLVIGRDDPSAADWRRFADELTDLGLGTVHVGDFEHDELIELIGLHHPASTSKQRHDLAVALISRRAALAAVAHELVRSADPSTLALTSGESLRSRPQIWIDRIAAGPRRIASIAAVFGTTFRVPKVAALGGFEVDEVVAAIDDLLDAQLVVAEQRPDEFSFRHVLVHADFDRVLDRGERRRLHLAASELAEASGDVHGHAAHLVEAGALVANDLVVAALLASARAFLRSGSTREAADAFGRARAIATTELEIDDLLDFAAATSRSGGDGWELRAEAFERARRVQDADRCLDVALSGALQVEDAMGQPRRVAMLQSIDPAELTMERRAVHAAALARELGLLGQHEQAIEIATVAAAAAVSPDNRMVAWLGAWASCRALPPRRWPSMPQDRHLVSRPDLVSRVAQIECARALVVGDDARARRRLNDFAHHHYTRSDPLRSWHASLVEATLSFVDGRWDDHRRQATEGLESAARHGVAAAFSTRFAQEFVLQWIVGQHGALLAQFERAAPDLHDSLLAAAAHAITLAEDPNRRAEARTRIDRATSDAHRARSPLSPAAAVLLASAPADCRSPSTTDRLHDVLAPFRGSAIVAGAVISHLGPASWALSHLLDDHDAQVELLEEARHQADAWNLRTWSIACRRSLAQATGDPAHLDEATELAAGTSLADLL